MSPTPPLRQRVKQRGSTRLTSRIPFDKRRPNPAGKVLEMSDYRDRPPYEGEEPTDIFDVFDAMTWPHVAAFVVIVIAAICAGLGVGVALGKVFH